MGWHWYYVIPYIFQFFSCQSVYVWSFCYLLSLLDNAVAGLEHAKKCVMEMVIWPLLRPDIFKGCRSPGKGLLLFGPPVSTKSSGIWKIQTPLSYDIPISYYVLGNRKNNDWESHSWRSKSNFLLYICKFADKQVGKYFFFGLILCNCS